VKRALLCTKCNKTPRAEGRSRCASCLELALKSEKRRRDKRIANGVCARCGKVPPREHLQTCGPCALAERQHVIATSLLPQMRDQAIERAARAGKTLSAWIRALVEKELSS